MVKLTPAEIAEMDGTSAVRLQVTPNLVPMAELKTGSISLFAVTAVVFTTTVVTPAATTTAPAAAAPQTAGLAELVQFAPGAPWFAVVLLRIGEPVVTNPLPFPAASR